MLLRDSNTYTKETKWLKIGAWQEGFWGVLIFKEYTADGLKLDHRRKKRESRTRTGTWAVFSHDIQIVIKNKDFQKTLSHTQSSIFWLSRGCVEVFNCFRLIEYLLFFQSSDKGGFFLLSELQNFMSTHRKNRIKLLPTKLLNNLITDWYFVLFTEQT